MHRPLTYCWISHINACTKYATLHNRHIQVNILEKKLGILIQISVEYVFRCPIYNRSILGLCSLSGRMSYRQLSRSLKAARLDAVTIVLLWNLTGISQRCCRGACQISKWMKKSKSESHDFTRFCGKTSYRLVNRGSGSCYSLAKRRRHVIVWTNVDPVHWWG